MLVIVHEQQVSLSLMDYYRPRERFQEDAGRFVLCAGRIPLISQPAGGP